MNIPPARPYTENSEHSLPWHTHFIGQHMQHNYWLYAIIDRVMMANPQIRSVVELGTGAGAVSTVFGLWGIKKEMSVLTIDNVIQNCIGDAPSWLFCDGGFKGKELQTFSPKLPKGSIISAHDLGTEFKHDYHAEALCREGVIEPYHPEWWMENNIQLAIYKKI